MRSRARTGWVCGSLAALLSLTLSAAHYHKGETETHYVSAGHLLLLRCRFAEAPGNVTWSRAGGRNGSLPAGVEVRGGLLWFLPVLTSHDGSYTCEERNKIKMNFVVSVSPGGCPDPSENVSIPRGVRGGFPCRQSEIFRLNNSRSIRWMKDCRPVEPLSLDDDSYMRLHPASEEDAGKYTCLVDVSFEGRSYTAARSVQLSIKKDLSGSVLTEPKLLFPQRQVVVVKVGMRAELQCHAYMGFSEDPNTLIYWTVGETFIEDYEGLEESCKSINETGKLYRLCTLSISKVPRLLLNVPIHCVIVTRAVQKSGLFLLQEADHSFLYTMVALGLTVVVGTLAAAAGAFFRLDVVLTHRKLWRSCSKQAPDGKLYDGYVSFLHPGTPSSSEMASFALQILPEELEKKHGYSLYIRGRDDCPGEPLHDTISAALRQCRRLIILLSPVTKSGETSPLCDDHNQVLYEQNIGVYHALTQNDARVILVEIGGPVDYSRLPESLLYIRRKQGALKWKNLSNGTQSLSELYSTKKFWKNLRYLMPPVPAGEQLTVI